MAYDIPRELPRTLRSLSVGYQREVTEHDYEVIVVDNGSPSPVDPSVFAGLAGQFRLLRIDDAPASPAHAVNVGLQEAQGDVVGVMLDGSRLASPGLVRFALAGSRLHPRSAVVTLGWYLGYDFQRFALDAGWTQADEDRLLESIDWPNDGYRLFEIATLDESSVGGWFQMVFESNALFLPASVWDELGGCDERFASPGGGLVNHDVLRRATELDGLGWVVLLGEATFHQLHGGIATNVSPERIEQSMGEWTEEYLAIRGKSNFEPLNMPPPVFVGTLPDSLLPRYAHALNFFLYTHKLLADPMPPPVPLPDPTAEPDALTAQWMEKAASAAARGLDVEALTFARWARARAPGSYGLRPLLSCVATTGEVDRDVPLARRAQFHVEAGQVHELVGSVEQAASHYDHALAADPGNADAYLGLTRLKMPGPSYYEVLRQIHLELEPATYLEIGVAQGLSLALVEPPTVAVAVDPDPAIRNPISVDCHLYHETSAQFFQRDVRQLFGGHAPTLVFIDGLHEYSAVLQDFSMVEAIADPDTIIVLHDMIPFDEITQRPERVYGFYTGDVWKLLHCLADVRPDLNWFTVRTPPSGLTFVSGLDPSSTVLRDQHDELVQRYGRLTFDDASDVPGPVVENDWPVVAERLRQMGKESRKSMAERTEAGAPSSFVADGAPRAELARRVRQLEEDLQRLDRLRRADSAELRRAEDRIRESGLALDRANAQLEAMHQTRLFRWSRPLRGLYRRVRSRSVSP